MHGKSYEDEGRLDLFADNYSMQLAELIVSINPYAADG